MTTSALIFCTKSKTKTAKHSAPLVPWTDTQKGFAVSLLLYRLYYIIAALTITTMPMIKYSSTFTTTKFLMPLL